MRGPRASGPITHFGDWSLVYGVQMRPFSGKVKVGKTQPLSVAQCYVKQPDDDLTWLGYECASDDDGLAHELAPEGPLNSAM